MEEVVHKLQAREVCIFQNFGQWVHHGSSWIFYNNRKERIICTDKDGYLLEIGEDFMESRDKDRFPVTVHAIKLSRSTK